jgi:predicted acetyltransferase
MKDLVSQLNHLLASCVLKTEEEYFQIFPDTNDKAWKTAQCSVLVPNIQNILNMFPFTPKGTLKSMYRYDFSERLFLGSITTCYYSVDAYATSLLYNRNGEVVLAISIRDSEEIQRYIATLVKKSFVESMTKISTDDLRLVDISTLTKDEFKDTISQCRQFYSFNGECCGLFSGEQFYTVDPEILYVQLQEFNRSMTSRASKSKHNNLADLTKWGRVPALYFMSYIDNKPVGAISVRLQLNSLLQLHGANIGYTVFNPYRKQGVAKTQLKFVCDYIKKYYDMPVLLVDCANIASENTVKSIGGKYIQTINDGHVILTRFALFLN